MGEIKGSDIIDQSAIKAPLELAANIDVLIKKMDQLIATMKKSEGAMGGAKSTKKVREETAKLSKSKTELQKIEQSIITTNNKLIASDSKQAKELAKLKVQTTERNKQLKLEAELSKKTLGTLEKLTLQNRKLTDERKKLNLETKKGQTRLKEINGSLDKNNKKLKDSNDQLGKQKINVGNYQSALSGLPGPLGGAARATQGLTSASLKFLATPIGAVIAALGLALGALTTFFKGSEEGQNSFTKITKAALVVWGNFKDIIIDVGKGLFKLVQLDFKGAKEAFSDAADGVKNFVAESKAEIEIQNRLSDLRAKNIKLQRELTVEEAKIRRDVAILREEAAKTEETDAANSAMLIRQAIGLQDELAAKREEVARNNLIILREEAALSESTTETLNEIADAEASLINVQTERANLVKRLTKELNTLEKKAEQQAKSNVEVTKRALEEIKGLAPTADEQIDLWVPTTDGLKARIDANIEEYKKGQDKLAEIDKGQKERRNEIIQESIDSSKEIYSAFTALRVQQISDELTALELARGRDLQNAGDNERAKLVINQQFDEERRKLQKKQANAEKANALFNIAINTAQSIVKTGAQLGYPAAIPFVIAAAAVGALQAAAVLSQKPPEFDKGSESTPKDYIAGEKKPELRKSKGEWSLVKEPTMFTNSPGDKIVSSKETDSILGGLNDLSGLNLLNDPSLVLGLLNNDFEKQKAGIDLAYVIKKGNQDVVNAITKKKGVNVNVNTSRAMVKERMGNYFVERIEKYYRS